MNIFRIGSVCFEEKFDRQIKKSQKHHRFNKALEESKTLIDFLPIYASCKKIQVDNGSWNPIETYIGEHSNAEFSHGICPECSKKLYPDIHDNQQDVFQKINSFLRRTFIGRYHPRKMNNISNRGILLAFIQRSGFRLVNLFGRSYHEYFHIYF